MAFFDKLGDTISSTSRNFAQKAKEMADVAGLNSSISGEEKKIENAYRDIGKLYYEGRNQSPEPEFAPLVSIIRESQRAIEGYRVEIARLKNVRNCKNCGAEMSATSVFCATCGTKNEIEGAAAPAPAAAGQAAAPQEAQTVRVCPQCGHRAEGNMPFCTECGAKLEP